MKETVKKAVIALGFEKPARWAWWQLKARGWFPWTSLVPEEPFEACVAHALATLRAIEPSNPFGDYLEFGVSRGTSMACVYRNLNRAGLHQARLIGFDSFEGLPSEAANEGWFPGQYHSTIEATRGYLRRKQVDLERVTLVKGWFKDTLTEKTREELAIGAASLIMIDCDIYSASKDALTFSEPHIREHTVVMFDDWAWREEEGKIGQKEAFETFLAEHPDLTAEPMPAYAQARVFLVRRLREVVPVRQEKGLEQRQRRPGLLALGRRKSEPDGGRSQPSRRGPGEHQASWSDCSRSRRAGGALAQSDAAP